MRTLSLAACTTAAGLTLLALAGHAQDDAAAPPAPPASELTLLTMLEQGGVILYCILGLGFLALVLTFYLLFTLTPGREVPKKLLRRATAQLEEGDLRAVYTMVEDRDELLARVLRAGLRAAGRDRHIVQEAMESEGQRGATALWQRITYLNNIATIAPLLGLLGTVWGMMQAFSAIHFDTSEVRNVAMAYSVSTAMVTTAAGLVLAIPAKLVYYYLRGRVIRTVATLEAEAAEMLEHIVAHGQS